MDIIAYKDKTNCPVRPEDLALLQGMTAMVADALAGSTSANVIMRGCEVQGNLITAGILCVNGELVFANAGLKNTTGQTKYVITETVSDAISNKQLYNAWTKIRRAQIDNTNGTFVWDDLPRYSVVGTFSETNIIETHRYTTIQKLKCSRFGQMLSLQGEIGGKLVTDIGYDTIIINIGIKSVNKNNEYKRLVVCSNYDNNNLFICHLDDDGNLRYLSGDISGTSYGGIIMINACFEF